MKNKLTHIDDKGNAKMVNVSQKPATKRTAIAEAKITMLAETISAIQNGNSKKGDVLAAARIAGIMAAKKTADLIPLCHPLALTHIAVDFDFEINQIIITTKAETTAQTGVEMEAMLAATIASLTIYDMTKALERGIIIEKVRLLSKRGGKSGEWSS